MGYQDVEGSGGIHLLGSSLGLAGAIALKPRIGVFTSTGRLSLAIASERTNVGFDCGPLGRTINHKISPTHSAPTHTSPSRAFG